MNNLQITEYNILQFIPKFKTVFGIDFMHA